MAEPSAQEQLFIELLNRARMDPLGEAARYGLASLNSGLPPGTITSGAKQVLAPNTLLIDAARGHSQWMLDADVFSHTGANGSSFDQRIVNAGYALTGSWNAAENIAWSGTTGVLDANAAVLEQHRGLFLSAGHRENILEDVFREVGVGALTGQFTTSPPDVVRTYNALMTTEAFARSGNKVFVTGVTYNDLNGDRFYSVGEGVAGRTFELLSGSSVVASAAGMSAGGYAIGTVSTGLMEIRIAGAGLVADIGATFTLGATNVKIDLTGGNTIETNVSATLTRGTLNLTLLGIESIGGNGNALNNVISGNAGANNLAGGNGDDRLLGGAGNDTLNGGAGIDTADYSNSAAGVTAELWRGLAANDGQGGSDTLVGIEHLTGSAFADLLAGDAGNNRFKGGGGNDNIYGGAGMDAVDYGSATGPVVAELWRQFASNDGQGGTDVLSSIENLSGSAFGDLLAGGIESNVLSGGAGNDSLYGGAGVDTADYSSTSGPIVAELWKQRAGNDGQGGIDVLSGIENLTGSGFSDLLAGSSDDNLVRGGAGNDSFFGGAGIDTADYSLSTSRVIAELWRTLALEDGLGGTDVLDGMENLIGSDFNDILGGDHNANRFDGGPGDDTMAGSGGSDSFVFRSGGGRDVVNDFFSFQSDKIYIESNINNTGITTASQLSWGFDIQNGVIVAALVNLGGLNTVSLVGVQSLDASDFVFF